MSTPKQCSRYDGSVYTSGAVPVHTGEVDCPACKLVLDKLKDS